MEKSLNYSFKRRSKSYFEWLNEVIKSEKYFLADSIIVPNDTNKTHSI